MTDNVKIMFENESLANASPGKSQKSDSTSPVIAKLMRGILCALLSALLLLARFESHSITNHLSSQQRSHELGSFTSPTLI